MESPADVRRRSRSPGGSGGRGCLPGRRLGKERDGKRSVGEEWLRRIDKTWVAGFRAERWVGDVIDHALARPGCADAHDVKEALDCRGNVDHIAITPMRIWVVETKEGWQGKRQFQPALRQVAENARRVRRYLDRLCPHPLVPAFFLAERGTPVTGWALRWTFAKLSGQVGLRAPSTSRGIGPRLHDLRHRFAVNTLLRWYRDEVDVERHIPRLATWLGHAHVSDTYWYLTATPELLHLSARRVDHRSPS